jgi:acyl-CoA dehydrogenase
MDLTVSPAERAVQQRASQLARSLMAYEAELDETGGLCPGSRRAISEHVRASGIAAMNMPKEWGGAGLTLFEQVLAMEQLGGLTNWLWGSVWKPANVLRHCTADQRQRYLLPAIQGRLIDSFSVTEALAGSDMRAITTTAVETATGFRLNGEKWFASWSERADVTIVLAKVEPGARFTLFLVDGDCPGRSVTHVPSMTVSSPEDHPTVRYRDVELRHDAVLGQVGQGLELTREWFVDERLYIAARCLGGAERALQLAVDWTRERAQFGKRLIDHQLVQSSLADSASEIALNRALLYTIAAGTGSDDRKTLHAKAAMVKLTASEAAGRITDRCVQLFGGRGQMRANAVERLWRSLRAERIWEGTSEIQRLIIANHIAKRGLSGLTNGPGTATGG